MALLLADLFHACRIVVGGADITELTEMLIQRIHQRGRAVGQLLLQFLDQGDFPLAQAKNLLAGGLLILAWKDALDERLKFRRMIGHGRQASAAAVTRPPTLRAAERNPQLSMPNPHLQRNGCYCFFTAPGGALVEVEFPAVVAAGFLDALAGATVSQDD
jgi:hypothetical protein